MINRHLEQTTQGEVLSAAATTVAFAVLLFGSACGGGAVMSGVAVGEIGANLSAEARSVPRGADVCAYQESQNPPSPTGNDKAMAEACKKATKSDRVWRGSMIVLGAYSGKLEAIAWGADGAQSGKIEGAMTGVNDASWADAEGADETAARDAVLQLATQLKTNPTKGDLSETIKQAAPHVKTLCDGLTKYLDAQVKSVNDIESDIEKKRSTRVDRRCASLDGKNICVQESVLDRMTYAGAFGDLTAIEASHIDARETVAEFCAAHAKLEEAAAAGNVSKDKTYQDIVDAVAAVPRDGAKSAAPDAKTPTPEPKPSDAKP